MTERLADVVLGLQRMAENAKLRGDDLRYIQQQETWEHVRWLDELLGMVDKVRSALLDERKRFQPPAERRDQIPQDGGVMPRIVKQGPKEAAG
jgi:hypothetical protein